MPNIEFIPTVVVVVLIAFIWFRVIRDAANEPFMAALIQRFRANDESTGDLDLKRRFFGWINVGNSVVRTSGTSKLAVTDSALFIVQLPIVKKLIPAVEIPLNALSKVDSRIYWSALSRFDVFEIDGIDDGKLLLPVGLVGTGNRAIDKRSAAT